MNTEQMTRFWLDGFPSTPTFREERAKQIITALLAERQALLSLIASFVFVVDNKDTPSNKLMREARQAIAMCEEQNNE